MKVAERVPFGQMLLGRTSVGILAVRSLATQAQRKNHVVYTSDSNVLGRRRVTTAVQAGKWRSDARY